MGKLRPKRSGFTLIEMLAVIGIISLLAGLMFVAARAARKRAHIGTAESEIRELAKAWKSYWLFYKEWPGFVGSDTEYTMTEDRMRLLQGDNPQGLHFLDIDSEKWENGYRDPWGSLYRVRFRRPQAMDEADVFETTVRFLAGGTQ
jgi:prepilin-type N-terminal cleavage/methylation domain-containing protein